jgi:hypothetical protein
MRDREPEKRVTLEKWEGDVVYIRMRVPKSEDVSFEVSKDEKIFTPAGEAVHAEPGRWVGVKAGLFAINEFESVNQKQNVCGSAAADYFVFEKIK